MKTSITLFLFLITGFIFGQKHQAKKLIGTWIVKANSLAYQDTIIFFKDNSYITKGQNRTTNGVWSLSIHVNSKNNNELYLLSDFAKEYKPVVSDTNTKKAENIAPLFDFFAEEYHPWQIVKFTRKKLIMRTFISWRNRDFIQRIESELLKID